MLHCLDQELKNQLESEKESRVQHINNLIWKMNNPIIKDRLPVKFPPNFDQYFKDPTSDPGSPTYPSPPDDDDDLVGG